MSKIYIKIILISLLFITPKFLSAEIKNSILVKVGNEIITSVEVETEIMSLLFINNRPINQEEIDKIKRPVVKSLITRTIKEVEIKKFEVTSYNQKQLDQYMLNIAKKFGTDKEGLKGIFIENNLDYIYFKEKFKVELLWNSLIFMLYKNQININPMEVVNTLENNINDQTESKSYHLAEIEILKDGLNSEKLDEIYKYILEKGFEETVSKYSISESKANRGDIGWIDEKNLSKLYKNELASIKQGDVSKPIKLENSINILKIKNIKINQNINIDKDELRIQIIEQKKQEKLQMFSRSHYSNLENKTLIKYQ